MTPEQFDICKDFHLELIRPKVTQETIDDAKNYLVNTAEVTEEARKKNDFRMGILDRFDSLVAWFNADTSTKFISIYNKNNTRNPADAVFYATFQVMNGGTMMDAMRTHATNYQCIKVLKPRIERWNKYSKMLNDTL